LDAWYVVLLRHLHGKEPEEQHDVLTTVSEWGHLYGDSVETIVEVFAKSAFADGSTYVDVGGSYYSYISFAYLLTSHTYVFARLEYTQKTCLGGERQFAYFVEEERALVGCAEVALRLTCGISVGALLMTKELGVDSALWNGATVDGEVFLASAW